MKKTFIFCIIMVVFTFILTGCRSVDDFHATVSLSTSDGWSSVVQSFNSSNATVSGKELAIKNRANITLKEGETFHFHFYCEECGFDFEADYDIPFAEVIHCDCPEEGDENGSVCEYYAFALSYTP